MSAVSPNPVLLSDNAPAAEAPGVWASVTQMPREDLALRATAVLLILYGSTGWAASVGLGVAAGLMLLHPRLIWSVPLWLAAIAVITMSNVTRWYSIDNHKYLILYWTIACAMAVGAGPHAARVLAANARLLVGLCFAFAMYWKVAGGEYLNGVFLHTTFLLDGRLRVPVAAASGMSLQDVATNGWLVGLLRDVDADGASVPALTNQRIRLLALASSYWTLLIEGAVAMTFLAASAVPLLGGASGRFERLLYARDWLLLTFVVTTYFLLPVVPFAMILCILGLSQVEQHRGRVVVAYLLAMGVIQLTMIPWQRYLVEFGLVV